jgi:hypothetical protein
MTGISSIHLSLMPLVIAQQSRREDDLRRHYTPIPSGNPLAGAPIPQVESTSPPGINLDEFARRLTIPGGSATFRRQENGSYRREFADINAADTSVWWIQGNTLYCEGGTLSIDNGTGSVTTQNVTRGVYSLSGENGIGHRNEEILPWTRSLATLNLTVGSDGSSYYVNGVGLAHHLVLNEPGQPQGRIWRADGQLYANGTWTPCATAPEGTMFTGTASPDGQWIFPSNDSNPQPFLILRTRSGRIIRFRSGTTDLRVFEYNRNTNSWSQLSNRTSNSHGDPEVRAAILNQTNTTAPLQTTTNLASINDYSTALSQNITANEGTNVTVSSRYNFPHRTCDSNCTDIAQLVSYTQNSRTHYRLLIASTDNTGRMPLFAEYSFSQEELQRLATEHHIPTSPNWNNPNEVLQWMNRHFSFHRDGPGNDVYWNARLKTTNDLLNRNLIPFASIRNLQWRPVWNLGTTSTDPIQTAIQRLQGSTNTEEAPLSDFRLDRRDNFNFIQGSLSADSFNLGSPITAERDVTIRDEIIRRAFGTNRNQVGVISFTNGTTNYVIGVRNSTIEIYSWTPLTSSYTMFRYFSCSQSDANAEINRTFSSAGVNLTDVGFNPGTQPTNEQEYNSNLIYYTNLLRICHQRLGARSSIWWPPAREGQTIDQVLSTSR